MSLEYSEDPSLYDIIRAHIQSVVLELHSAMPGKVVSYNSTKQTAVVQPLIKWQRFLPGAGLRDLFNIEPLTDVLVCHPRAGDTGMHLPLAANDLVLLVFCDRSITGWRSGSSTTPGDPGAIQPLPIGGAVCLPLMHHDSLSWAGSMVSGSTVNIGKSGGSFDAVAQAQKVFDEIDALRSTVNSLVSTFNTHTHTYVGTGGPAPTTTPLSPATAPAPVQSVACSDVKVS